MDDKLAVAKQIRQVVLRLCPEDRRQGVQVSEPAKRRESYLIKVESAESLDVSQLVRILPSNFRVFLRLVDPGVTGSRLDIYIPEDISAVPVLRKGALTKSKLLASAFLWTITAFIGVFKWGY